MKIIRNIIVAFSLYSRIPMPHFEWKEDDTKFAIGFIWLIGGVIGGLEYALFYYGIFAGLPTFVLTMLWCVIPLIVTGGFHVDGFMDVMDAFSSYKPKEEKLKILKDPHIGAFAVIGLVIYGCIYASATYMLITKAGFELVVIACIGFVLLRAIGALISIVFPHAKKDGMLHEETKKTNIATKAILIIVIILSVAGMGTVNGLAAACTCAIMLIFILWYYHKCKKEFGGISGDTVGYFITVGELLVMCIVAVLAWV